MNKKQSLQNTAPRQVKKKIQKTLASVDGMELKALLISSKELTMNKEITDCDGTISTHYVEQFLNSAK